MANSSVLSDWNLEQLPTRCPVIPEAEELGFSARYLPFGKGRGVYRIIFHIREDERHVRVLRIWHGFRDTITAQDVEDA